MCPCFDFWFRRYIYIVCFFIFFIFYIFGWLVAEWLACCTQARRCRVTVLGKLFTPIVHLFKQKIGSSPLVAVLQAWRKVMAAYRRVYDSPAGWLPRTGISSGTPRSVIEYGLPLPFLYRMLPDLTTWPCFLHFFLTYLLPYLSVPLKIDPLRFQAECRKRWLNLALVFLCCSTFLLIGECVLLLRWV